MNYLNFFILLASIQGFLLAFVFGFSKVFKRKSSRYLGLLIFVVSLQNLSNGLITLGHVNVEYYPFSLTILIPFSLYFFGHYFIDRDYPMRGFGKLMFGFFLGQLIYKIGSYLVYLFYPDYIIQNVSFVYLNLLFEVIALIFTMIVLYRLNKLIGFFEGKLLDEYADIEYKTLSWLRWTLVAVFVLSIVWALAFVLLFMDKVETVYAFFFVWIGISLMTYWLAYSVYIRRHLFETDFVNTQIENQETTTLLSENTEIHHQKLLDLMTQEKLYQDPDLNMTLLAKKMNLSKGYLSLIINQKEGKNFFEFVNAYRVEQIKNQINDPEKAHYSLLGIAMDAGFKSKSTFNSVFKKLTGQTPSQFKKSPQSH